MLMRIFVLLFISLLILFFLSCNNKKNNVNNINVSFKYNSFQVSHDTLSSSYTLYNNSSNDIYIPIYPLLFTGISHPGGSIFKYPTHRYGGNYISYYPFSNSFKGITDNFGPRIKFFPKLIKLVKEDSIRINYYCPIYNHKIFIDSVKYIINMNYVFYSEKSIIVIEKFLNRNRKLLCYNRDQFEKCIQLYPFKVEISPEPNNSKDFTEPREAQIIKYHYIPSDIRMDYDDYYTIRSMTDYYYNEIWICWKKGKNYDIVLHDTLITNNLNLQSKK